MAKDDDLRSGFDADQGINKDGINVDSGFIIGGNNSQESISKLTHINGLPISELEARMRPISVTGTQTGMYSYEGSLGENESLIESLLKANQTVNENGLTHQELAEWLELAVPAEHVSDHSFTHNGMRFNARHVGTVSRGQWSPFKNDTMKNDTEGDDWDGEFTIVNLDTGRTISFTPQMPRWIRNWGFYEGYETPFHVEPQQIIDVFTKTDRVYQTKEEVADELRTKYEEDGWDHVQVGEPQDLIGGHEHLLKHVAKYRDDLEGDNKLVQVLEDDLFIVVSLGIVDINRRADYRVVGIDKRVGDKPIAVGGAFSRCDIKREIQNGIEVITIHHDPDRGSDQDTQIVMRQYPSENGWTFEHRGSMMQVGDWELVKGYGSFSGSSEDQFKVYRNNDVEFITQDVEGSGMISYIYKTNRVTGQKYKVLLTPDAIGELLGIELGENERHINEIKDITVSKDGTVQGTMMIGSMEHHFSL